MNIFSFFFAILWFAMVAIFLVSVPILGFIGYRRKSWKFFGISTALSFLCLCIGSAAFYGFVTFLYQPYDPHTPEELASAYAVDFGEAPPKGVAVLKARQYAIADSGVQWLLLSVDSDSIDKILAYGFSKSGPSGDFIGKAGPNAPNWWSPPSENIEYYENQKWPHGQRWSSNHASIGVDRKTKQVWCVISRID